MNKLNKLKRSPIYFGCDPEFFFQKDGKVVGAEKVLPENGIEGPYGKIIIDGVQAELNPQHNQCREVLANNIGSCFGTLMTALGDTLTKTKVSGAQTVKITEDEMNSLSDKSKQFGCSPSRNLHNKEATTGVSDASKYFFRSAGGHIHIGMTNDSIHSDEYKIFRKEPERIVAMLDVIVGNTCVMIDRDEGNIIRRQTYGRAGEHRLPSHGIEYRTLSNFWLQSYTLMSLVMSLSRLAVSIVLNSNKDDNYEKEILSRIDINDVVKAINENDFDLAKANFDKIKGVLTDICRYDDEGGFYNAPFTPENIEAVEYFIEKVRTDGLKYWFQEDMEDIPKHWSGRWGRRDSYRYYGWESFIDTVVTNEVEKNRKIKH